MEKIGNETHLSTELGGVRSEIRPSDCTDRSACICTGLVKRFRKSIEYTTVLFHLVLTVISTFRMAGFETSDLATCASPGKTLSTPGGTGSAS